MSDWYARIPIFAGLEESALKLLSDQAHVRHYEPGDRVFEQGDTGSTVYLIESGRVNVLEKDSSGKETSLAELPAGDFFGEMAILECSRRSAGIEVIEKAILHELSTTSLYKLFMEAPDQYAILIVNIARDLARRLHKMDEEFIYRRAPETRLTGDR
ncbi:MAG: cyclic nucleotide-binding domain-containing protein [Verrucomicrobiota bacterium]